MSRLRSLSAGFRNSWSHNIAQKRDRGGSGWRLFAACFAVGAVGLTPMSDARARNSFLETPFVSSILEVSAVPEETGKPSVSKTDNVATASRGAFNRQRAAIYFNNIDSTLFFQKEQNFAKNLFETENKFKNKSDYDFSVFSRILRLVDDNKVIPIKFIKPNQFLQYYSVFKCGNNLKFHQTNKYYDTNYIIKTQKYSPLHAKETGRRDAIVSDFHGDGDIYNEAYIWSCGSPYGEWIMETRGGVRSAGTHAEAYGTFFVPPRQDGISTSEPFIYEGEMVGSVPSLSVFWRGRSHATAIAHVGRPTRGPLKLGIELLEARDVIDVLVIDGKPQMPPPPQIRGREPIQWKLIQFGSSDQCPRFDSPEECEPHVWDARQRANGAAHYRELLSSRPAFIHRHRVHVETLERCDQGAGTTAACIGAEDAIRRSNKWLDNYMRDCERILDFFADDPAHWQDFIGCLPDAGMPTMARMLEEYCDPSDTCDLIHDHVLRGTAGSLEGTHRRLTDCAKALYEKPSDLAILTAPSWFFRR